MTTPQHAQGQFVHRLINWERVESRLKCYPAIGRAFPLKTLKKGCESLPYYCHYMAWRLGTWEKESRFQRLEELLDCAEAIPDWKHEKSLLSNADFSVFWSLVWQLQVAEHLCKVGTEVSWAKSGPDLSVKVGDERWYVECYNYCKSFGLLGFLKDLLSKIDPDVPVRTYYDRCSLFQLPNNLDQAEFLDKILSPFLNPSYLADAKEATKQSWPVVLFEDPCSSLRVYVDGNDFKAHDPSILPCRIGGNPGDYLTVALREAVCAKQDSNDLKTHRPNLLAVNYLISDWEVASDLPERCESRTYPELKPNIDALAAAGEVGIEDRLTREKFNVVMWPDTLDHKHLNQIASTE